MFDWFLMIFIFQVSACDLTVVWKRTLAREWLPWRDDGPLCPNAALAVRTACASEILRWQSNGPEVVSIRFRVITTLN